MGNLTVKKRSLLGLMLLVSFFSKAQNAETSVFKTGYLTAIEKKILDTVVKLPECRRRAAYIEKQTKGSRHLGIDIYGRPSEQHPYYRVKAWEDNGISYVTHFNFYVYPKTFAIKFYDTENGRAISLMEWRRQTKSKGVL